MLKKMLCLFCSLAMVFTVVGCGNKDVSSNISNTDADVDIGGFMGYENAKPTGEVTSNEQGGVQVQIERPDEPTTEKSILASKNYGGQKFKYLYWYTPDEGQNRLMKAFNKAHNAKVEMVIVNDDPTVEMAKSIASGQPYDIVAANGNYFPQSIFKNIYEELESYISKEDMFNANNYEAGGFSQIVNDRFAFNGHYYALGSHKSVYLPLMYYNKKMYNAKGLEDPWELYKKGQWTWDKMMEHANKAKDLSNGIAYLNIESLAAMNRINGISAVSYKDGVYSENLTSADMIKSAQLYWDLWNGSEKISLILEGDPFMSGKLYTNINTTDSYTFYKNAAMVSSAFGSNKDERISNLGTVPVPFGPYNTNKVYASVTAQGCGATKGCKDPSVAACYALFESRWVDKSTTKSRVPQEVLDAVQTAFAKNGFVDFSGFEDSTGKSYNTVMDDITKKLKAGDDVNSTLTGLRNVLQNCIKNSTSGN